MWYDQESGLQKRSQNFKKPLDIFLLQIERKSSKEHLVIILAEKSKYRKAGLKHKLEDSGFLETL